MKPIATLAGALVFVIPLQLPNHLLQPFAVFDVVVAHGVLLGPVVVGVVLGQVPGGVFES
jgi:hypothetical protein